MEEKQKNTILRKIEPYSTPIFLLVLTIVACIIVYYRLQIQLARGPGGPGFDTFAFLANALNFAGMGAYFEITRPPVLSLITSIFFRFGLDQEITIYLIDAFFYVVGAAGLFLLLKIRFNNLLSFTGGVLFLSFPDMVDTVTFGITDVIAISMSIWLIYFTILAVQRNKRYFLVVFPLLIIAFLTRFPAALMIFPIIFYLVIRQNFWKNIKPIAQGASFASLLLLVDLVYYWVRTKGDLLIQFSSPFQVAATTAPEASKLISPGPAPSVFYFLTNFPKSLGQENVGLVFLGLFMLGMLSLLIRIIKARKTDKSISALIALAFVAALSIFLIFSKINFLLVSVILLFLISIVFPYFFDIGTGGLAVDLLLFFWLLTFFSYHTHQAVKVSRYFITMAPGAAYLIVLGLSALTRLPKKLGRNELYSASLLGLLAIATLSLTLLSAKYSYEHILAKNEGFPEVKEASDWLKPRLKPDSIVFADYFVGAAWYLRTPVRAMPSFEDPRAFNHELEKYGADYYIAYWRDTGLPSYKIIKRFGPRMSILAPNNKPRPDKPRVFFIGKGLHTYLENLVDFRFYLIRKYLPFPDIANRTMVTTYIDDYSLDELNKYPVLALYNFRWKNINNATKLIQDYLKRGGTAVIDISGNSGDVTYDLNGTDFLGVAVTRQELPARPRITIQNQALQRGIDTNEFASFVDENGGPWKGSTYIRIPTSEGGEIEKSVMADGKMLIGVQKFGKGKIIWVGFNFLFHAQYYENKAEKQLVQNVFRFAAK